MLGSVTAVSSFCSPASAWSRIGFATPADEAICTTDVLVPELALVLALTLAPELTPGSVLFMAAIRVGYFPNRSASESVFASDMPCFDSASRTSDI